MPRSSAWNERVVRGASEPDEVESGPGTDDRGWIKHSTRRSREADLPDVPPENLLAKGGLNRHGVSTGRPREADMPSSSRSSDTPGGARRSRRAVSGSARTARRKKSPKTSAGVGRTTVKDALTALDALAPFQFAADWDNVGLLAGRPERKVASALVAIDLTDAVASEALRIGADLLVIYHPPIFKGIRSVTAAAESPTSLLPDLLAARVAIISLHTALDAAVGGTNDILLDCFEVVQRRPLEPILRDGRDYKLVLFAPADITPRLRAALAQAGAGVIGNYSECSYELAGAGTFRGNDSAKPAIGEKLRLERVEELRLEMIVPAAKIADVVRAVYENHSYEEPAFDLYPLRTVPGRGAIGMGRVGRLAGPTAGTRLVELLKKRVDCSNASMVGDLRRRFTSVTTAAGSFGVRAFRDPDSLVITGEFKHHDALELRKRGVAAVHLGHYESEQPLLDYVARALRQRTSGLRVSVSRADRSPFQRM